MGYVVAVDVMICLRRAGKGRSILDLKQLMSTVYSQSERSAPSRLACPMLSYFVYFSLPPSSRFT